MGEVDLVEEPATTACHLKSMGRDAMNLVEFPLALLADRAPQGCKTLTYEDRIQDRAGGGYVTRRLTVSGSDRFGLPTALDDEVSLGLLQLTKAENFANRRVRFNRYQLLRILGWRDEGKSYVRLDKSLKRWTGVTLFYENAWRDNREKRWVNASFHLLDEVVLRGRSRPQSRTGVPAANEPSSYFTWNEIVFESFRAGYLKRLDMDLYRQRKRAAAKRIYRFLDKRFHFTNELCFDLASFAYEHVGLSRHYDSAQLKRRLAPAIRELEQNGFLRPMDAEQRYHRLCRGKWEILLVRAPQAKRSPARRRPLSALEDRLVERGVSVTSAARTVRDYPAEQIQSKIDTFDLLAAQPNSGTLRNPAGFLVQSIRQDYVSPAGLRPSTVRKNICQNTHRHVGVGRESGRKANVIDKLFHVEQSPVAAHLAKLSSTERDELEQLAIARARGIAANGYRRAMESGHQELAKTYLDVIVEQHLKKAMTAAATCAKFRRA